jgi:hypothetical protein
MLLTFVPFLLASIKMQVLSCVPATLIPNPGLGANPGLETTDLLLISGQKAKAASGN